MKNNKVIILIVFLIIIIIIGVIIAVNMSSTDKKSNVNEINTENNINAFSSENISNTSNMSNILEGNEIQNNNLVSDETIENDQTNLQSEEINNNEENLNIGSDNMNNQSEDIKINLIVNNKTFSATLNNNETVRQLISMFPMTLNMSDLHSNEKYNYLDTSLKTNSNTPKRINAGDIKLYGNNCLVVFYDSFNNSYSYTDLGKIDNVNSFVAELGKGSVTITFELAD